ncbi:hypothetical protein [Candidatus Uabimicrobium sp. HlEnr_7]|uniref:hypothetical protein n=1 Tax=Candidatus Uabimicrobium helgolandensis TaxID=3095367 RepID=UPI00355634CF
MKLVKLVFTFVILTSLILSLNADTSKKSRKGDNASEYILKANGDLFRIVDGQKLQVTTRVADFKISHHPQDAAMIYFIRDNNLYILKRSDKKSKKAIIFQDIAKAGKKYRYNVAPSPKTTIVNLALSGKGEFRAWDNKKIVLQQNNVVNYKMNNNFAAKGKPFSSYVAFAIDTNGYILKIKGKSPGKSKWDNSRSYKNIKEFKRVNGLK